MPDSLDVLKVVLRVSETHHAAALASRVRRATRDGSARTLRLVDASERSLLQAFHLQQTVYHYTTRVLEYINHHTVSAEDDEQVAVRMTCGDGDDGVVVYVDDEISTVEYGGAVYNLGDVDAIATLLLAAPPVYQSILRVCFASLFTRLRFETNTPDEGAVFLTHEVMQEVMQA